ncbi:ribonuclease H-like domain-containing protein [Tanacetum coccineum]
MHYSLPHPDQGVLGLASAIYASQPTTLPSAFSIMPLQDPTWHMDTYASSHLNFNAINLSTIFDKRLFSSVHVGDGKSIPVTNTGHSIIFSHHRPLHLHNVLVTPNIIKNLIFVRQFTRDNNYTIKFDAFGFSVNDYLTRHILLRCDSSSDLYLVTKPSTTPTAFLSTSASTWHQRLRHPAIPNAEPNTPYGQKTQGSTPTEPSPSPQSTLLTLIAHNHANGPSTSAQQTSSLPPPIFNFPNSQPNTVPVHEPPRTHPMITRSQSGIVKPIDRLSLHTFSISPIPKNPSHALKDPNWSNAMYDEYNALAKNGTWLLVPRSAGVNMVRSMWLFKHKFHADGTLSRYKARLIANGSSQQLGVDFDETFSPVVKPAIIRTVLSLAVSRQWPIHQLDVKNAFLNGDLSETVYMHHLLVLLTIGYATRAGFYHSRCDSLLFIYRQGSQVAYLLIYVDDIILTASCPALLQQIIGSLNNEFDMTDLGTLNYFLGISADRTPTGLFLSQKKYALQLLEHAHMVHCNPSRTPVDTGSKLGLEGVPVQDPTLYRSLAGGLQYLTFTRPDLSYLYASATTSLVGYTDVDWAAKRQQTLSRSSAEAEYCGVANVVVETAWLHNLLRELHSPLSTATLVYCDNVSVVYMSANPVQHQRTKHIEIDIHFVRDMVTVGQVRVLHVPSRYHYADIFTKGLPSALFEEFRSSLSVHLAPTAGAY